MSILTKAIDILKKDIEENAEPIDSDYNIGISHAICVLEALKENDMLSSRIDELIVKLYGVYHTEADENTKVIVKEAIDALEEWKQMGWSRPVPIGSTAYSGATNGWKGE